MGPESTRGVSPQGSTDEVAATREALDQAQRGDLMTLTPEVIERIAETGDVPEFVRDSE